MAFRRFEYKDAKSDKFWEIELDGNSYTVHYGRCGTNGQTKTKDYADEKKAKKEFEKIIAKKMKSGYVEIGSAPPPAEKKEKEAKKTEAKPRAKVPTTKKVVSEAAEILGLPTKALHRATWRTLAPIELPKVKPFDRAACEKKLAKLKLSRYGYDADWESLKLPLAMSKEEAHYWYEVMTAFEPRIDGAELLDRTKNCKITGEVPLEEIRDFIERNGRTTTAPIFKLLLVHLLTAKELATLFANAKGHSTSGGAKETTLNQEGFRKFVYPNLSESDLAQFKEALRSKVIKKNWPGQELYVSPVQFHVAAILGMHEELRKVVDSWPDDAYSAADEWADHYHRPQQVIFGLGSSELVIRHMKRLKLRLRNSGHIRAWLAHTEFEELDYVADSICQEGNKDDAAKLMTTFCAVKSPKMAGPMLRCSLESKAPAKALAWLNENVEFAIIGLIPLAAGLSKYAEPAAERLQSYVRQGLEGQVRECLNPFDESTKQLVDERVFNAAGMNTEPFTDKNTPQWLKEASEAVSKKAKLPKWINPGELPPVVVGDNTLSPAQTMALFAEMKATPLGEKSSFAIALKKHANREALSKFAWKLFEHWQTVGAPSKDKWAFLALGHLGDDTSVLKLTPLVRSWPGQALHARAVQGLQIMRAIGTDTALQELSGIAAKLKFKGLKKQANRLMEEIANDLGLSREDLEDRVVPSCGLDERGNRVFDFGPRKFTFVLGPEMKPMVKDEKGKRKANLPKPGKNDDEDKAKEAVADWKLIKKQIRQVCKIQGTRLEQAMIRGRRWRTMDFRKFVANHPLMTHIGQSLLWAQFSEQGTLLQSFRITEEQDFANEEDDAVTLDDKALVGVVHPLALPEQQRSTWGQVFADYEIIPPFTQLGRTVYSLEKGEETKDRLDRFEGLKLPAPTLVFGLEKFAWSRGLAMDAGGFCEHSKIFQSAGVTAVVLYEGVVGMQYIDTGEHLTITDVYFVPGARQPGGYAHKEPTIKLSKVDPIVLSEVLHDLNLLASKAE